jgi:hypothetical protein
MPNHPLVGAIIGWKFNHAQGMSTVDGVIVKWPDGLGPQPTQENLDTWATEYETFIAEREDSATKASASANAKLLALGLTDDEIASLRS